MPTMEELELTVLDLANRLAEQERRNRSQQATLDAMMVNGIDDLLTGHGYQQYGGGGMRLDGTGIQILADDLHPTPAALYFFAQFLAQIETLGGIKLPNIDFWSGVTGFADNTDNHIELISRNYTGDQADWYSQVQAYADASAASASLVAQLDGGPTASAALAGHATQEGTFFLTNVMLVLSQLAADPAAIGFDGSLWYRTDIDKFRARINGVTENLATESYVAATAYTNVEDEGIALTHRSTINFTGAGVTASDSGGKTVVNIPGGGGPGGTTSWQRHFATMGA